MVITLFALASRSASAHVARGRTSIGIRRIFRETGQNGLIRNMQRRGLRTSSSVVMVEFVCM